MGGEILWMHALELCVSPAQGTNVILLPFSVHNDPAQSKDPATFGPAHFLDPEEVSESMTPSWPSSRVRVACPVRG